MAFRAENETLLVKRSTSTGGTGVDIQNAIDTIVNASPAHPYTRVLIPAGEWTLDDPILLNPAGTGINFSLELSGVRSSIAGNVTSNYTTLHTSYNDAPAIISQATRAAVVRNMTIVGLNNLDSPPAFDSIDDMVDDSVFMAAGVTTDHVGIDIDPEAGGGSSKMLVENVGIVNFAGGIRNSGSGDAGTLNSEAHTFKDVAFHNCGRYGIAFGQNQTKHNLVLNCSWDNTQYLIECLREGTGQGYPPVIIGGGCTNVQRLFNIHHTIGTFNCHGLHVEGTWSLGTLGGGFASGLATSLFTGCQFGLWRSTAGTGIAKQIDVHCIAYRMVKFDACDFGFNVGNQPSTMRFHNGEWMVFDTCTFGHRSSNSRHAVDFNQPTTVELRRCKFVNESTRFYENGVASVSEASLGSGTISRTGDSQAQFTIAGAGAQLQVGDHVRTLAGWVFSHHTPGAGALTTSCDLGVVTGIAGDVITLGQVPISIENLLPITDTIRRRRFTFA